LARLAAAVPQRQQASNLAYRNSQVQSADQASVTNQNENLDEKQ
jgi:ribosome biogenesis GTPase A